MRKLIINITILVIVLLPLLLWSIWLLMPTKKITATIVDKTVLTTFALEHRSFDWVLEYRKYRRENGTAYSPQRDYFGFFPLDDEKFEINDLSKFTPRQLDSLSEVSDMTFYTDTYGIYHNEWYRTKNISEHSSKIYGGLDPNDVTFLEIMKKKKKLILTEFNLMATPTENGLRQRIEDLFGLHWTGWTGRYFEQLDTIINPELPKWVTRLYREQNKNQWPFKRPGIVFVNRNDEIVVLESKTDLAFEVPQIHTFPYGVDKYNLPKSIRYPYWFDITLSSDSVNRTLSYYQLQTNLRGDSILDHYQIPKIFPAVFERKDDIPFYYFCGDFSDMPVHKTMNQLIGIQYFKMMVLNEGDFNDRTPFFWRFYLPLTSRILNNYFNGEENRSRSLVSRE